MWEGARLMPTVREYVETNKMDIVRIVRKESIKQYQQGNDFDVNNYILNYFSDLREGVIGLDEPIEQSVQKHMVKTKTNHIRPVTRKINIPTTVDNYINKTYNAQQREIFNAKYRDKLVSKLGVYQTRYGNSVLTNQLVRDVQSLKSIINTEIKNSQPGVLSPEDRRRLLRMKYLLLEYSDEFQSKGIQSKDSIDGGVNSHIVVNIPSKNNGKVTYIVTPSKIINHSIKKVIYTREYHSSTVKEFKDAVGTLQKQVDGSALTTFVKYMGQAIDLRKTVIDNEGNKL